MTAARVRVKRQVLIKVESVLNAFLYSKVNDPG